MKMEFEDLVENEGPISLITVVETVGSSPSRPGAWMAVRKDGSVIGSIAGGCVEAAVYHSALEVLDGEKPRLEEYGPEGDIFRPGLTCGGRLTVWISLLDREVAAAAHELTSRGVHFGVMTTLHGPQRGAMRIVRPVEDSSAGRFIAEHRTGVLDGAFVQNHEPPARMIIVGSTSYAEELCSVADRLGYRVSICDAREVFTTSERFSNGAHEVVCDWPARWIATERKAGRFDGRTVFVVLTHDPKIDIPVLREVLSTDRWQEQPAYVGALGSSSSDKRRRAQLRESGITDAELEWLHSPIGLAIGDDTPAETAISIAAQLISVRSARASETPRKVVPV